MLKIEHRGGTEYVNTAKVQVISVRHEDYMERNWIGILFENRRAMVNFFFDSKEIAESFAELLGNAIAENNKKS